MKRADIEAVVKGIGPPLRQKFAALEKRISALEERPLPEHVGAWQEGKSYTPMQMVQHASSCWLATRETSDKPGEGNTAWRLIAKGLRR